MGKGVHVGNEVVDGIEAAFVGELAADMVGEGVGSDIIRCHKSAIEEVAEGQGVSGLEINGVDSATAESTAGDGDGLGKIDLVELRPVENDQSGGHFGEAGDLAFIICSFGGKDVASLVINDDVVLGGGGDGSHERDEEDSLKGSDKIHDRRLFVGKRRSIPFSQNRGI